MDLNDYWQENKRFLTLVASGGLVFLIGRAVIGSVYGSELSRKQAAVLSAQRELRKERFGSGELGTARAVNQELKDAVEVLGNAVSFKADDAFKLAPGGGPPSNQYFEIVTTTREELMKLTRRNNVRVPESVGLPALSPTRELKIVRYLEALDVIDRVVHMAVDAGVERIDKIDIQLDPGLESSRGIGSLERTEIAFTLGGSSTHLVRLLAMSQTAQHGGPIMIQDVSMRPERSKTEEARLEVTFLVARLHLEKAEES